MIYHSVAHSNGMKAPNLLLQLIITINNIVLLYN
jgi:hypothetical protein